MKHNLRHPWRILGRGLIAVKAVLRSIEADGATRIFREESALGAGAMTFTPLVGAILGVLVSLPALAQGTTPVSEVCLQYGEIYSWNALDNRTLIVEDNWHHKFKVSLLTFCPSLQFRERVGFRSPGAMRLTCLSRGDDVVVRDFATGFQRCPIKSVEPYTPAMQKVDAAAAAAKAQPKD